MIRNALTIEMKARRTQFVEVDCAIPCILHANNRTAEKFLRMLLVAGVESCQTKTELEDFIAKLERTINCDIFGKMGFNELGQWRVPIEKGQVGDVKLPCMDANKRIEKMKLIVDVCAQKPLLRINKVDGKTAQHCNN